MIKSKSNSLVSFFNNSKGYSGLTYDIKFVYLVKVLFICKPLISFDWFLPRFGFKLLCGYLTEEASLELETARLS